MSRRVLVAAVVSLLVILPCQPVSHASVPVGKARAPAQFGWSMPGHDPQRTSRSPIDGPTHPHLLFSRKKVEIDLVGPDGRMYGWIVQRRASSPWKAARFSPSGHVLLRYRPSVAPVGLLPDGTLLAMNDDGTGLRAFSLHGKLLWRARPVGLMKSAVPLVTVDSHFYAPFEGHPEDGTAGLDIFDSKGARQRIQASTPFFAVALSPDRTIYALIYLQDSGESRLEALDRTGKVLWQHQLHTSVETYGTCTCLLVGRGNILYTADGAALLAYDPQGHPKWRIVKSDGVLALAERADGVLLVAGHRILDALKPDGMRIWAADIRTAGTAMEVPSLIVDASGTAYVGTPDGRIRVISSAGKPLALLPAGGYHNGFSPRIMLGVGGRLVVNGTDGVLRVYGR